jgi:hypothetical protein
MAAMKDAVGALREIVGDQPLRYLESLLRDAGSVETAVAMHFSSGGQAACFAP